MPDGRTISPGWRAERAPSPTGWRVDYQGDQEALARELTRRLDGDLGFAIITGIPVSGMSLPQAQEFAPRMLSGLGQILPQGPVSALSPSWLVRDEGSRRFDGTGQYNQAVFTSKTRDSLDIHNDNAMRPYDREFDCFALLAYRKAKFGGESVLVHARSVYAVLEKEFPDELDCLRGSFPFERGHVIYSGQAPLIWAPVFEEVGDRLRVHCNRQRIEMAVRAFELQLGDKERNALDALDLVLARPELRISYLLDEGECLVVNDHEVLHGRTAFQDYDDATRRRCLIRVLVRRR
jgi:hypothetical protein